MPLLETFGSGSARSFGRLRSGLIIAGHVTSGLTFDWDFADPASYPGSGNTITDRSGNGRTGTKTSQTLFETDAYGGGLVFTGVAGGHTTYVDFPSNTNLVTGTADFTLESWWKWDGVSGSAVLLGNYPGNNSNATAWMYYGGFYLLNGDGYLLDADAKANNGLVNHMVVTRISGNVRVYFNNTLERNVTNNTSIASSQWRVGSDYSSTGAGGETFKGKIYATRAYNRGLSALEVSQNWNAYTSRFGR
jgi:hypothetical protein